MKADRYQKISGKTCNSFLTLLLVVIFASAAFAPSTLAQTIKFYRKAPSWVEVPGRSVDVGIGTGGIVYAIARDGRIWRWGSTLGEEWRRMPGKGFRRVDVDSTNKPWVVTKKNDLMYYNGLWWERRGIGFKDVGAGADGTVIAINLAGNLHRWNRKKKTMEPFLEAKAARVDIDQAGLPWIIDAAGAIYRHDGKQWQRVVGTADDIGIGPKGATYAALSDGTLAWWTGAEGAWQGFPKLATVRAVSVGPDGKPWVVLANGKVLAADLFQRQREEVAAKPKGPAKTKSEQGSRRQSSRDPALSTSNKPILFTKVNGQASKIAIGRDGSVFALSTNGKLTRWSNKMNKFRAFPGTLSELAVTPEGYPLGVNRNRDIFRHNGKNWTHVRGSKARDIAIGTDGTVVISDIGEVIKRKLSGNRFLKLSGKGRRVAVSHRGMIWTLRETGAVSRCEVKDKCSRVPGLKGKEIAVGPDGSVFIITPSLKLYRFVKKTGGWKRVSTPERVIDVAVGPKGRPWIVDVKNNVHAANFFKRDESRDAALALGSSRPTSVVATATTSTTATITFTKNIRFEEIHFDDTPATTDFLSIGIDGSVYVIGDSGAKPRVYDEKRKILENFSFSLPENAVAISTDADGRIWMIGTAGNGSVVYHQKKKDSSSFKKYTLTNSSGSQNPDIEVGGDGTVFAVARDKVLYKFNAGRNKFEKFSTKANYKKVSVTPNGRPWVIETDNDVKEYDGDKFVKPGGRSQTASDLAIGANGSVYIVDTNSNIKKWNASSRKFDNVNISGSGVPTTATNIAVQPEGRPWFLYTSSSSYAYRAKK